MRPSGDAQACPPALASTLSSPARPRSLSARTRAARLAGRCAEYASRRLGRGSGGVIGGRVMLRLAPHAPAELSAGRTVVCVSGTNGKTTTTAYLAAGLGTAGPVATNADGANMPGALTKTLAAPGEGAVVLETDEAWLPWAHRHTSPGTAVLLNLSRDQLDRHHEVNALARRWRAELVGLPHVVANADDPAVVYAASAACEQTWVSVGGRWHGDALVCPRCGDECRFEEGSWSCTCGLRRPHSTWRLDGDQLVGPSGSITLRPALPGRVNLANAAMAVVTAASLGIDPQVAADALTRVTAVAGRYAVTEFEGRRTRLLLAKNPAGWAESLDMLPPGEPLVLALNADGADGRDPSWLYDVDFTTVLDRPVVVTGRRATDLLVRLEMDGATGARTAPDVRRALRLLPPGPVVVVGNYTAFQQARRELDHAH